MNHRQSLSDGILIKDNHLALLRKERRPVEKACRLACAHRSPTLPIIVEVESLAEVRQALTGRPDIILLDNMAPSMVKRAVSLVKKKALVEVSGGITLKMSETWRQPAPIVSQSEHSPILLRLLP